MNEIIALAHKKSDEISNNKNSLLIIGVNPIKNESTTDIDCVLIGHGNGNELINAIVAIAEKNKNFNDLLMKAAAKIGIKQLKKWHEESIADRN